MTQTFAIEITTKIIVMKNWIQAPRFTRLKEMLI